METNLTSVPDGAFALECPACPHPGRNLPEGWDHAPEETRYASIPCCLPPHNTKLFLRWLYSYFIAVDANFRLKLKSRGISDPEVGSGWSYFVGSEQYNKHVSQTTTETEVSLLRPFVQTIILTCLKVVGCSSEFHAVNQANSKSSRDYTATGVVACVCARHCLMQKNGVGDLQRGERYVRLTPLNMQILIVTQIYKYGLCYRVRTGRAYYPRHRHLV
jgi:hypothetical protein